MTTTNSCLWHECNCQSVEQSLTWFTSCMCEWVGGGLDGSDGVSGALHTYSTNNKISWCSRLQLVLGGVGFVLEKSKAKQARSLVVLQWLSDYKLQVFKLFVWIKYKHLIEGFLIQLLQMTTLKAFAQRKNM